MQSLLALLASHDQLATYLTQVLRACVLLALLLAVFVPLEHYFSVRPAAFLQKGWLVNLGWYFINSLTPIFLLGPPAVLLAWMVHAVCRQALPAPPPIFRFGRAWSRRWSSARLASTGVIAGATRSRCCGDSMRFITARPM